MTQVKKASTLDDLLVIKTNTFLDKATGINGIPRGRITEFWGDNNAGKSTACLQTVLAAQQQGLRCLWVDVENTFEPRYAREMFGIDMDKLGLLSLTTAEEFVDETVAEVRSGNWDVIIFDSIGSLSSQVEIEKTAEQRSIGLQASLMSRFSRLIAPYVLLHKIAFIGVNHARTDIETKKIYQMGGKFWSEKKKLAIRFREKTGALLKSGENVVGKVIIITVSKNHVGPTEGLSMEVRILNGQGFSHQADLFEDAVLAGIIGKQGNTYYWGEEKLGTKAKVLELMKDEAFVERLTEALV